MLRRAVAVEPGDEGALGINASFGTGAAATARYVELRSQPYQ